MRRIKKQKKTGKIPELKVDYNSYCPGKKEKLLWTLESMGIIAGMDFLFYRSAAAVVLWLPFVPFWFRWKKKQAMEKRRKDLYEHFRDLTAACSLRYAQDIPWKTQ